MGGEDDGQQRGKLNMLEGKTSKEYRGVPGGTGGWRKKAEAFVLGLGSRVEPECIGPRLWNYITEESPAAQAISHLKMREDIAQPGGDALVIKALDDRFPEISKVTNSKTLMKEVEAFELISGEPTAGFEA